MNKHLHRIIFNHLRCICVVVAERTTDSGKGSGNASRSARAASGGFRPEQQRRTLIVMALGITLMQPANAAVVSYKNAPANQQPTILKAGNSGPLVNIRTPSAGGVSRNSFSEFDIDPQGVILNNSRKNVQTQLGGWVQGNPWLGNGTARVILNEIFSSSPSLLNGYIEVAGDGAQVIIANPTGITCNGCGFINAHHATLTTGVPVVSNGNLDGYRVEKGTVRIEGNGMDAGRADYTNIIARAVKVNAGIWANDLNITTGTNLVDVANTRANSIAGSGGDPQYALDVAQLGGMYAGKITMTGTEAGLGVRNAGEIGAANGALTLTVDGRLENTGRITSQGNARLQSQGFGNSGRFYAGGNVGITSGSDIGNSGILAALGNLDLGADHINSSATGILAAGVKADGSLAGSGNLAVEAGASLTALGQNLAGGDLAIRGQTLDLASSHTGGRNIALISSQGSINTANSVIIAGAGFGATSTDALHLSGAEIMAEHIRINASRLDHQAGRMQAVGSLNIDVGGGEIDNHAGLLRAGAVLGIKAGSLDNSNTKGPDQGIEGSDLTITTDHFNNSGGAVRADLGLSFSGSGMLDNSQGLFSSAGTLSLADRLVDPNANVASKTLQIINTGGTLIAANALSIDSRSLTGDGKVQSLGSLLTKLTTHYTHTGEWQANGDATFVTSGNLTNQAKLHAAGNLGIAAGNIDNQATGEISGGNTHLSVADTLTNRGLIDGGNTFLEAAVLDNLGTGRIYGDHLAIDGTTLSNLAETLNGITSAPVIASRHRLDIGANTINNREHAMLFSAGDTVIGGNLDANHQAGGQAGKINNGSATVEAIGDLQLNATEIRNTNLHFGADEVLVSTETIAEFQGNSSPTRWSSTTPGLYHALDCDEHVDCLHIPAEGVYKYWYRYDYTRTIMETQIVETDPAKIFSGGGMHFNVGYLLNDTGQIVAGGVIDGNINTLDNTEIAGRHVTTDAGILTYRYKVKHTVQPDNSHSDVYAYNPAPVIQSLTLTPTVFLQNTLPTGSGTTVAGFATGSVSQTASGPSSVIRTAPPTPILGGSLYRTQPDPAAHYLIVTDPAFANYRTWLSSDYLLQQLALDPARTQKRLGDGFYEQKLVREQIAQLTGRRFLDGYADDEAQYRALMAAGTTYAKAHGLIPGVALTEAQMAQLTSDIVWLVEQTVTLADGTTQKVLVPQVYVRLQESDLHPSGVLIAGDSLRLNLSGDFTNRGTLAGRQIVSLTADNIQNFGGQIHGADTLLTARTDLNNLGGILSAADRLQLKAGRDINVTSTSQSSDNQVGASSYSRTTVDRVAGLYVTHPNGTLVADAGRDLTLMGAEIINNGNNGQTVLDAGRDLTISTLTVAEQNNIVGNSKNYLKQGGAEKIGSTIQTRGDLTLNAGHDLNARAATVTSGQGALTAIAGHDLGLEAGQTTRNFDAATYHQEKGLFSSSRTTRETVNTTGVQSGAFSGDTVTLVAGHDLAVTGSNVVGTHDVNLIAGNNVTLDTAQATRDESHYAKTKKSGVFASGSSLNVGSQKLETTNDSQSVTNVGSTVGSVQGDITINAGKNYRQTGSDVLAPQGDIAITVSKVDIEAATDTYAAQQTMKFKQSGLSASLSNPILSAVQTASQMKDAASQTSDPRMQALAMATSALTAKNAYDAVSTNGAIDPAKAPTVNLNISLGTSKSSSKSSQNSTHAQGSTVAAGRDVTIVARGGTWQGGREQGDITVTGSDITAGRNATLFATDDITLQAATNTTGSQSKNKNSSASVGVSVGLGAGAGISATASLSKGKGNSNGRDLTHTNTHVSAGNTLILESGNDTTLKGAAAKGHQVIANVGFSGKGNFNVTSLQDSSSYQEKQRSAGLSISAPITGPGTGFGGSLGESKTDIKSDYQSVTEQSGIKAGDGGYQINVQGNTDLMGTVIATNQKAIDDNKNRLTTETLTTSDIQNKAEYQGDSASFSAGVGRNTGADGIVRSTPSASAGVASEQGSADSVTVSGISAGTVQITDNAQQQSRTGQDTLTTVAQLNRDVKVNANGETVDSAGNPTAGTRKPIFDQQAIQRELNAAVPITQVFSQVAPKAVGDYAAAKIAAYKGAQSAKTTAERVLNDPDGSEANKAHAQNILNQANAILNDPEQIAQYENWKEGGAARAALHAVVGGLTGNLEGALGAGVSAATIPALAQQIDKLDAPAEVKQALIMGLGAAIGGAAGGAAGAGTGLTGTANNFCVHNNCFERRFNLADAIHHWRNGEGVTVTDVAASELNLTDATFTKKSDGVYQIHTSLKYDTGAIYGTVTGILNMDGTMSIKPDLYNFDFKGYQDTKNIVDVLRRTFRNVVTKGGEIVNGSGVPFIIEFTGTVPTPKNLPK